MGSVLLLGLDSAAGIAVAQALGVGSPAVAARIARQLRVVCLRLAIGVAAVALLTALSVWLATPDESADLWAGLIAATGCVLALNFGTRAAIATLSGARFLPLVNLARVVQQAVAIAMGYALFRAGYGVVALPIAECVSAIGLWVVLSRIVRYHCPWTLLPISDPWNGFRPLFTNGIVLSLAGLGAILEYSSDPFILLAVSDDGLRAAALYTLWARLPSLAFSTCMTWGGSAIPSIATAFASGKDDAPRLVRRVLEVEFGLGCLFAAGLAMWLPAVMRLWVGTEYDVHQSFLFAGLFGAWMASRSRLTVFTNVSNAVGAAKIGLQWLWIFGILKIGLGLFFASQFGVIGLAIASTAAATLIAAGFAWSLGSRGVVSTSMIFSPLVPLVFAAGGAMGGWVIGYPPLLPTIGGIAVTGAVLIALILSLRWFATRWTEERKTEPGSENPDRV